MEDAYNNKETSENMHLELRNPSDALQILTHTRNSSPHTVSSSRDEWHTVEAQSVDGSASDHPSLYGHTHTKPGIDVNQEPRERHNNRRKPESVLDSYELVERGLIHPGVLPELLLMLVLLTST